MSELHDDDIRRVHAINEEMSKFEWFLDNVNFNNGVAAYAATRGALAVPGVGSIIPPQAKEWLSAGAFAAGTFSRATAGINEWNQIERILRQGYEHVIVENHTEKRELTPERRDELKEQLARLIIGMNGPLGASQRLTKLRQEGSDVSDTSSKGTDNENIQELSRKPIVLQESTGFSVLPSSDAGISEFKEDSPPTPKQSTRSTIEQANKELNEKMLRDREAITDKYKKLTLSEKDYAIWALEEECKSFERKYGEKISILDQFEDYKKKQQSKLDPKSDLSLAPGVAVKQIQSQPADYVTPMVQAYNEINASAEDHWVKMLSGQESFSQGMKSITKDLTQSITQMWIKMMYQQYIYNPLQDWFTGLLGGIVSGSSGGNTGPTLPNYDVGKRLVKEGFIEPYATGGYHPGGWAIVGEEGPELVNFSQPGRVYTAQQTRAALTGTEKASQRPIQIVMNISTPDVGGFRQSQGQIAADFNSALAQGRRNL